MSYDEPRPTREERPRPTASAATKALVVVPELRGEPAAQRRPLDARAEEAVGLARAIALDVVETITLRVAEPRPATLIGTGKLEELKAAVLAREAALVIIDHALSPIQQRNLEKALAAKVLDRTGLILEIFGERARTREGRLQVELAHLTYQKSRLVRSWTHLERQRGGFGFLGGPGESQIESDRRQLQDRIDRIEGDLEEVMRTRALHRKQRVRNEHPTVALVGYTNAGKSTLFNRLAGAEVTAADMLFATLDPTLRTIALPRGTKAILSDTVGFVSDLPTHLVAAFRATLEEVVAADLILHVRDIAHPESAAQAADVAAVLKQLDIDAADGDRVIEVWNKVDLLPQPPGNGAAASPAGAAPDSAAASVAGAAPGGAPVHIPVSALTGEGVDRLLAAIERHLLGDRPVFALALDPAAGEALAWLYRHGEVLERRETSEAIHLVVRVAEKERAELGRRMPGARQLAR